MDILFIFSKIKVITNDNYKFCLKKKNIASSSIAISDSNINTIWDNWKNNIFNYLNLDFIISLTPCNELSKSINCTLINIEFNCDNCVILTFLPLIYEIKYNKNNIIDNYKLIDKKKYFNVKFYLENIYK